MYVCVRVCVCDQDMYTLSDSCYDILSICCRAFVDQEIIDRFPVQQKVLDQLG